MKTTSSRVRIVAALALVSPPLPGTPPIKPRALPGLKLSLNHFNILLAVAMVAVSVVLVVRARMPQRPPAEMNEVDLELGKVLQWQNLDLDLEKASIHRAIVVLNRSLVEHPETARFRVALWKEKLLPAGFHLEEAPPPSRAPRPVADPAVRGINLHIIDISFYQALMEIADGSGHTAGRLGDTIYLVPGKGNFGRMTEWNLEIDSHYTALLSHEYAVKENLRSGAMTFYEGSAVQMLSRDRVRVRNLDREMGRSGGGGLRFPPTWRERLAEGRSRLVDGSATLWHTVQAKLKPAPPSAAVGIPGLFDANPYPVEDVPEPSVAPAEIPTPAETPP